MYVCKRVNEVYFIGPKVTHMAGAQSLQQIWWKLHQNAPSNTEKLCRKKCRFALISLTHHSLTCLCSISLTSPDFSFEVCALLYKGLIQKILVFRSLVAYWKPVYMMYTQVRYIIRLAEYSKFLTLFHPHCVGGGDGIDEAVETWQNICPS